MGIPNSPNDAGEELTGGAPIAGIVEDGRFNVNRIAAEIWWSCQVTGNEEFTPSPDPAMRNSGAHRAVVLD